MGLLQKLGLAPTVHEERHTYLVTEVMYAKIPYFLGSHPPQVKSAPKVYQAHSKKELTDYLRKQDTSAKEFLVEDVTFTDAFKNYSKETQATLLSGEGTSAIYRLTVKTK